MSEPLSQWLSVRESADAEARSLTLFARLLMELPSDRPFRIVDLASGTGSNIRYLAPRLPEPQEWLAVDRDPALLAQTPAFVHTRAMELGTLDDPALFAGRHLVTASALLDLVSAEWMERLAHRCAAAGAAVLFTLTYDGRCDCDPRDPDDALVQARFNQHQRRSDKGFGRAAGPDAPDAMVACLRSAGYRVERSPSDWRLGPDAQALQRGLIQGWADAATEIAPEQAARIGRWLDRRLAAVVEGRSRITVGHTDIAGWLSDSP